MRATCKDLCIFKVLRSVYGSPVKSCSVCCQGRRYPACNACNACGACGGLVERGGAITRGSDIYYDFIKI